MVELLHHVMDISFHQTGASSTAATLIITRAINSQINVYLYESLTCDCDLDRGCWLQELNASQRQSNHGERA